MENIQQTKFIKISEKKVGAMSLFANFFYSFVWFYRQWKSLKNNAPEYSRVSPFWRALFFPFYSFSFVKALEAELAALPPAEDAKPNKTGKDLKAVPWMLIGFFIMAAIAFNVPDKLGDSIGMATGLLLVYTMAALQRAVNAALPADMPNEGAFKLADFFSLLLLLLTLVIIFAAVVISAVLGVDVSGKVRCFGSNAITNGALVKNNCMGISAQFPLADAPIIYDSEKSGLVQNKNGAEALLNIAGFEEDDIDGFKNLVEYYIKSPVEGTNAYTRQIKDVKLFCQETVIEEKSELNCLFNRADMTIQLGFTAPAKADKRNKELFNNFLNSLDFYQPVSQADKQE